MTRGEAALHLHQDTYLPELAISPAIVRRTRSLVRLPTYNQFWILAALALLAALLAAAPAPAAAATICSTASGSAIRAPLAQAAEPHQAGLVIDFGDGRVLTFCVDLGEDGQATGEELLRASNLPVIIEYNGGIGGAVCKIDTQGSDFPSEPCFSHCTLRPGEPCLYWSYSQLVGDRWQFSQIGASSTTVHSGDVNGWAWGPSTIAQGALPPLRTLAEICRPATATPTASPTLSPTTTPSARPTVTVIPVAAPPAIETPYIVQSNTPTPSATAAPTRTATASPVAALPTPTASSGPAPGSPPAEQSVPITLIPTLTTPLPPTATPDLMVTLAPAPTSTLQVPVAQAGPPAPDPASRAAQASLRIQLPLIQHAGVATPSAMPHPTAPVVAASAAPARATPTATATPAPLRPVAPGDPTHTYPYFGGMAALLLASWAMLRRGRAAP